ncbi:glycosyltransferase [Autumnicola musiva]|uniref:Glycosyltransferase n=1 Tax=Autumnicola musiva TaxID=3075589 RepID=A0ABU3D5G4_9FLAO|nr:glycosyltransferase [Zunongwangia sp. F117]MDT0676782.1 glycosyltransferase [Zunongwangia sp. F117]
MRVLQLIDSLRPGGAELMAVSYANALSTKISKSYLCCTREEGILKERLMPEVSYLFLCKKNSLDMTAFMNLNKFLKAEKIDIIHAHGTSYFMAGILNFFGGDFKLVWHDHYGNSEFLSQRSLQPLSFLSGFFDGIISVNTTLEKWAKTRLKCKKVIQLNNFVSFAEGPENEKNVVLKGEEKKFKIICVANLRPQKDHYTLLKAFEILAEKIPTSLHLLGQDPCDEYSGKLKEAFQNSSQSAEIFYYGEQTEVNVILKEADLGVLSSRSEGLPLALLEYAGAGLPVVVTNVGECSKIVGTNGILVEKGNPSQLASGIMNYYFQEKQRNADAKNLKKSVQENFSEKAIIKEVLDFYRSL